MIRWVDVRALAEARGWDNANKLARAAGLSYPVARRFFIAEREPLERIDVQLLESLAAAFGVKPWALLEHVPEKGKGKR